LHAFGYKRNNSFFSPLFSSNSIEKNPLFIMIFIILEHILAHTFFFLLFLITFIFWGKTIYTKNEKLDYFGKKGMVIAYSCVTGSLLNCWIYSRHLPLRAVAMSATDGLMRGMRVIDTRAPLSVLVGEATLGCIFNVFREPVDNLGLVDAGTTFPIHRFALCFTESA
jgi:hypothetical protein